SKDYLNWAWEMFGSASNTKFLSLVRGSGNNIIKINRVDQGFNEQISCTSLNMSGISSSTGQPYPKDLFKVILIHELAHIIQQCNSVTNSNELTNIVSQEGYLSSFSANASTCAPGDNNLTEDFAETITYYLNRNIGEQTYFSACAPINNSNPFDRGNKPLHLQFAIKLMLQ
ncbi:MAG: hypothetical protein Q7R43_06830, partial [Candidatus Daviesbacteria bacterium]|nr:hypothetical protein [Candidatus Daviesbacteria bacterium]